MTKIGKHFNVSGLDEFNFWRHLYEDTYYLATQLIYGQELHCPWHNKKLHSGNECGPEFDFIQNLENSLSVPFKKILSLFDN